MCPLWLDFHGSFFNIEVRWVGVVWIRRRGVTETKKFGCEIFQGLALT